MFFSWILVADGNFPVQLILPQNQGELSKIALGKAVLVFFRPFFGNQSLFYPEKTHPTPISATGTPDYRKSLLKNRCFVLDITTVRLKYIATICKEVELFRSIPVGRFLQRVPVQIEDFEQGEV